MSSVSVSDNTHNRSDVSESLAALSARRPALSSIIAAFSPLFEAKERLQHELEQNIFNTENIHRVFNGIELPDLDLPEPDASRLAHGVPVLSDAETDWIIPIFPAVLAALRPAMLEFSDLQKSLDACERAFFQNRKSAHDEENLSHADIARKLIAAYLSNDSVGLGRCAESLQIPLQELLFITQQGLGPILGAYANRLNDSESISWNHGYCPVCGSFPSVGYLARKDPEQSEFLAGGGGQKHLHCSLCNYEWRYQRGVCPSCDNKEAGAIEYLHAPDTPWERIEYCKKCKSYMNVVDLRKTTENTDLNAAALGMMHLDVIAVEKGLAPLCPLPWNTFG